jgi:hypothetical protein
VSSYDKIAELPLEIDTLGLEGRQMEIGEFVRKTTLIHLAGAGKAGVGEDVVYDVKDHDVLEANGAMIEVAGRFTVDSFSRHLEDISLWPEEPERPDSSPDYRRWAFESAALDLALRQAGYSLTEVLEREAQPLTYVVSMRLSSPGEGEPETSERLLRVLEMYPGTRFKLDPTNTWTPELVEELAATGAVDSLDLKGQYKGTPVDVETDPELYRLVIEAFPDAWLEDPDVNDETKPILDPVADRITWDAPIHSVADVLSRPWRPKMVNIKPSRFGPLSNLFEMYDWCESEGVLAYGGGQTELGVGRDQIQYLAALFHPDTPNDTAPGGFNQPELPAGMPSSPIDLHVAPSGFRFRQ